MSRKGFTLIELLAALTIFLVVVSASYALFDGGRQLASRGEYHARRFQSARAALRAIESDLKSVFTGGPYDGGFLATHAGTEERPLDTIEAVAINNQPKLATPVSATLMTTPPPEFDLSRVAYSIDEDEGTKASGLVRRRVKLISEMVTVKDPEEGLEEISADVVGLRFRFYDGSDWQESWDSKTSSSMPRIIEATVYVKGVYREKEEIETFTTKFYLPLVGGGSR
ncbi:MAG TPA: prepilin-type N-terminal cleavage/methylation domain-containing protein [Planctomycetota bacterium]|nr:prepilin-type N-terminal cleavage/methylation domain-containing protein [Planctomycetota bacterium]